MREVVPEKGLSHAYTVHFDSNLEYAFDDE